MTEVIQVIEKPKKQKKDGEAYKKFIDYWNGSEEYRNRHREYILERVKCPCGCYVQRVNKSKHMKTKKHMKFMESQPKEEEVNELEGIDPEIIEKVMNVFKKTHLNVKK